MAHEGVDIAWELSNVDEFDCNKLELERYYTEREEQNDESKVD